MHKLYKLKGDESFLGAAGIVVLSPRKTCRVCGKTWVRAPALSVVNEDGIWWNCACKSTLVVLKQVEENANAV